MTNQIFVLDEIRKLFGNDVYESIFKEFYSSTTAVKLNVLALEIARSHLRDRYLIFVDVIPSSSFDLYQKYRYYVNSMNGGNIYINSFTEYDTYYDCLKEALFSTIIELQK